MSHSPARRFAYVSAARSAGRRWRTYLAILFVAVAAITAVALFPQLPLREGDLGLVLGALGLMLVASMVATNTPPVDGRFAGPWGLDGLRKVRGWQVIDNVPLDGQDIHHAVIAPAGVLAVETKHQSAVSHDDRLEIERHLGDLTSAEFAAHKIRVFLRAQGRRDATVVVPVLMVCGPGAPDLPGGHRIDNGVHVVDGARPELWMHRFNSPRLMPSTRRDLHSLFTGLVAEQVKQDAKLLSPLRHEMWQELRGGIAHERANRGARQQQARALRRHGFHPARIPGPAAVPAAAPAAMQATQAGG